MPYNNSNELTDKEFYMGVARFLGVTYQTAKKYWEDGFNEFIVRELYFKGSCRIPHLGTFALKHMAEGFSNQKDENGNDVVYKILERDIPYFTPHDTFVNDVNMQGVTKKYRKRLKKGQLTQRDYERQIRAEKIGAFGSMSAERIEKSKENFQELLKKKKEAKADDSNEKS